jgi:adenylate cyclase
MTEKALRKEGTILFCDIRNFTNLFEKRDPVEAVKFANSVLAVLGEDVEKNGGVVDRFTGDGFLAHFGILNDDQNHIEKGCRAAISLRNVLQQINTQRYFKVESVLSFGIGIHTGNVAYGKIETPQISQHTVLGDVVNTASRIEGLTNFFALDILASEKVYKGVHEIFNFKKMPVKKVKGKKEGVQTYWLLPTNF